PAEGDDVEQEREGERRPDEERVDRHQQRVVAARHDHLRAPFFPAGLLAAAASEAAACGRGGRRTPVGSSTRTWRTPADCAAGARTMRAKPESILRAILATPATVRPGG